MSTAGGGHHRRVLDALGLAVTVGEHHRAASYAPTKWRSASTCRAPSCARSSRVLESMHLVESRRRLGVTVRPADEWNVYDPRVIRRRLAGTGRPRQPRFLTALRSGVEPVAAGLAARLATPGQCAELTGRALGMVAASRGGTPDDYLVHDIAFHRVVLAASGNEMFARLGDVVAEILAGRTHHGVVFEPPDPAAVTLHVQVAQAVREGDPASAEDLTRRITAGALHELDLVGP
jgi:DNA-binding FadR family transcriptional regulator